MTQKHCRSARHRPLNLGALTITMTYNGRYTGDNISHILHTLFHDVYLWTMRAEDGSKFREVTLVILLPATRRKRKSRVLIVFIADRSYTHQELRAPSKGKRLLESLKPYSPQCLCVHLMDNALSGSDFHRASLDSAPNSLSFVKIKYPWRGDISRLVEENRLFSARLLCRTAGCSVC